MIMNWLQSSYIQMQGVIIKLSLVLWIATIVISEERNSFKESSGTSDEFVVKHKLSKKYIKSRKWQESLVLWDDYNEDSHFVFQPIQDHWGYIIQAKTGQIWHPNSRDRDAKEDAEIGLYYDKTPNGYFAIDTIHNHIIHHASGLFVDHIRIYSMNLPNGVKIELDPDIREGMEFVLENPNDPSKPVAPYGPPEVYGEWRLIYSITNALVEQEYRYTFRTGKSTSESTTHRFKFAWEFGTSAKAVFKGVGEAGFHSKINLGLELEQTTRETWSEEVVKSYSITARRGESAYVWQRVYVGRQAGHVAVFQSEHFKHTATSIAPDDSDEASSSSSFDYFVLYALLLTVLPLLLAKFF